MSLKILHSLRWTTTTVKVTAVLVEGPGPTCRKIFICHVCPVKTSCTAHSTEPPLLVLAMCIHVLLMAVQKDLSLRPTGFSGALANAANDKELSRHDMKQKAGG